MFDGKNSDNDSNDRETEVANSYNDKVGWSVLVSHLLTFFSFWEW